MSVKTIHLKALSDLKEFQPVLRILPGADKPRIHYVPATHRPILVFDVYGGVVQSPTTITRIALA